MNQPRQIPWPRDPHTAAKHEIYRRYLERWFPIMLSGWGGSVTYAEGFSGPGVYLGGEAGSPVIALESLIRREHVRKKVKSVRYALVEQNPRSVAMLDEHLRVAALPWSITGLRANNVDVQTRKGDCEPKLLELLNEMGAWGKPILMVLDTFGGAVSADLLRRVASNPGSEVLVTMEPQYFTRFADVSDITQGDKVFGGEHWRQVKDQPSAAKKDWLMAEYRRTVVAAGFQFVVDFELVGSNGHSIYLIFGTTHRRGLEKMKEAVWEVDPIHGIGYKDPKDPLQQTLEIEVEPNTGPLRRMLVSHLNSLPGQKATINELRDFALFQTVYRPGQVRSIVSELVQEGMLKRDLLPGALQGSSTVSVPDPNRPVVGRQ